MTEMNEAWTWRPLGELFEIGAGKTMSAAARNGTDKTDALPTNTQHPLVCKSIPAERRQWFQLTCIIVIQGLRGLA